MATLNDFPRVYVGPTVLSIGLAQFTVYADALPPHVQTACEKYTSLPYLIVPVSQLVQARADLKKKGTFLNQMYERFINELKKK